MQFLRKCLILALSIVEIALEIKMIFVSIAYQPKIRLASQNKMSTPAFDLPQLFYMSRPL